jgi:hypothetical protein
VLKNVALRGLAVFLDGLQPALQHGGIVINRRTVEAQQSTGNPV